MKLNTRFHIVVFLLSFFLPQFLIYAYKFYTNGNIHSLFFISPRDEKESMYFKYLAENMNSEVGMSTLNIFFSNTVVASILLLAVIIVYIFVFKSVEKRSERLAMSTFRIAYFICLLFFIKEGFRVGFTVTNFYETLNIPYLTTFLTLIFPHAILEFTAFILVVVFSLNWLLGNLYLNKLRPEIPSFKTIIFPFVLILSAAVIETTITPFIFKEFLIRTL